MKNKYLFLVLFGLITGCSKKENDPSGPKRPVAGYFVLTQPASSNRVSVLQNETVEFDLGDLRSSRNFNFSLVNGGQNEITDISLATDHAAFIIFPSKINSLKSGAIGINQIIGLDVIHGKSINSSSTSALLPPGNNEGTLTVSGLTLNEKGESIPVMAIAKFKVSAKIMDVEFYDNDKLFTVQNPVGSGGGFISGVWLYSEKFTIKNTGNINIKLRYSELGKEELVNSKDLAIGEKADFYAVENFNHRKIEIDGGNTIADSKKFLQNVNDGKILFHLFRVPSQDSTGLK